MIQGRTGSVPGALALAAILPLLAGCRDGPTTLTAPLEDGVAVTRVVQQTQPLSVLHDMFSDPFIHELIGTANAPALGRRFDLIAASGDISSASRAVAATRYVLPDDVGGTGTGDDQDHDLAILRDVLELLLIDAEEVLSSGALLDHEQRLDLLR